MANVAGMKRASSIHSYGMNSVDRLHKLLEQVILSPIPQRSRGNTL